MTTSEHWTRIRIQDLAAMVKLLADAGREFEKITGNISLPAEVRQAALEQVRALRNWRVAEETP